MIMVTGQIVINLSKVHEFKGGSEYPYPMNQMVNAAEVLTLDMPSIFRSNVR